MSGKKNLWSSFDYRICVCVRVIGFQVEAARVEAEEKARAVEAAVKETEQKFQEALAALEEIKKKGGVAHGAIWWMGNVLFSTFVSVISLCLIFGFACRA